MQTTTPPTPTKGGKAGHWADFVDVIKNKGKAFTADTTLIPVTQSVLFPNIPGKALSGEPLTLPVDRPGAARLVAFSFKQFGFEMSIKWIDAFTTRFAGNPDVTALQISFIEQGILRFMSSLLGMGGGRGGGKG